MLRFVVTSNLFTSIEAQYYSFPAARRSQRVANLLISIGLGEIWRAEVSMKGSSAFSAAVPLQFTKSVGRKKKAFLRTVLFFDSRPFGRDIKFRVFRGSTRLTAYHVRLWLPVPHRSQTVITGFGFGL